MNTQGENPLALLYEVHKQLESGISFASQDVKTAQENLLAFNKVFCVNCSMALIQTAEKVMELKQEILSRLPLKVLLQLTTQAMWKLIAILFK